MNIMAKTSTRWEYDTIICEPSRVLSDILLTFGNSNLSLVLVAAHDWLQTHFVLGISWA